MMITAQLLGARYLGTKERPGDQHHPLIQWWFELCRFGTHTPDEVPWCAAFVNGIAWELDLPRTMNAAARSWLAVGQPVALEDAVAGFDVVILERGQTGGHVGFYVSHTATTVRLLGGNQSNAVTEQDFDRSRVLGVRRLL